MQRGLDALAGVTGSATGLSATVPSALIDVELASPSILSQVPRERHERSDQDIQWTSILESVPEPDQSQPEITAYERRRAVDEARGRYGFLLRR